MTDLSILEKIVVGIAVVSLVLFVTFKILGVLDVNEKQYVRDLPGTVITSTCNTTQGNYSGCTGAGVTALGTLTTALGTIPTWVSVVIVVAVGGFLIMFLRKGFGNKKSGDF